MKAIALTIILGILVGGTIYYLGGSNPLSEPHNQISWSFPKPSSVVDIMRADQTNPVAAAVLLMVFSLMLFLPFWPGLRESLWPRDKYPLPIEMEYSKDPRHLSKSFRNLLVQSLKPDMVSQNIRTVRLSKEEVVEIKKTCRIHTGDTIAHTLMVQKDMHTESQVKIDQDLYVIGSANIGEQNEIRTLACDGDIIMGRNTHIMRWTDAVGKINIGSGCNLGASCSTVNCLTLSDNVQFRRLFGNPVITPGYIERPHQENEADTDPMSAVKIKTIEDITYYRRKSSLLKSGTVINQNVIVKGDLNLEEDVTINGDVRCEGRATIGKACIIRGDLFSEGPVELNENAIVKGSVFSQDSLRLHTGTCIGKPGCTKSAIAKKKITLDHNVVIYGYVLTEGKGLVL